MFSNYQPSQLDETGIIEHFTVSSITAAITYDQFFDVIVKEWILFIQHHTLLNLLTIHPLSIKHSVTIAVILNASSPSLSFTPLAFILHLLNIRVILNAIAHIHTSDSESLIRLLALTVIQHAPTVGLIVKHITFPSLSIITQIQHLSVFNSTHLLSIHSQQLA